MTKNNEELFAQYLERLANDQATRDLLNQMDDAQLVRLVSAARKLKATTTPYAPAPEFADNLRQLVLAQLPMTRLGEAGQPRDNWLRFAKIFLGFSTIAAVILFVVLVQGKGGVLPASTQRAELNSAALDVAQSTSSTQEVQTANSTSEQEEAPQVAQIVTSLKNADQTIDQSIASIDQDFEDLSSLAEDPAYSDTITDLETVQF